MMYAQTYQHLAGSRDRPSAVKEKSEQNVGAISGSIVAHEKGMK